MINPKISMENANEFHTEIPIIQDNNQKVMILMTESVEQNHVISKKRKVIITCVVTILALVLLGSVITGLGRKNEVKYSENDPSGNYSSNSAVEELESIDEEVDNKDLKTQYIYDDYKQAEDEITDESLSEEQPLDVQLEENEVIEDVPSGEMPSEDKIDMLLEKMLTWTGMRYIALEPRYIDGLTDQEAVGIAAYVNVRNETECEYTDDYYLIVPNDVIERNMFEIFGKQYDIDKFEPNEYNLFKIENGNICVAQGDWGESMPEYVIDSIEDHGDFTFSVNVKYYEYDWFMDEVVDESHMYVTYECACSETSPYGFTIRNMIGKEDGYEE